MTAQTNPEPSRPQDSAAPPPTPALHVRDRFYIGGAWVEPLGTNTLDVVNSATEEVMGRIPAGTPADAEAAIRAARTAFDAWSRTDREERAALLDRISQGLSRRQAELAVLVAQEVGTPFFPSNLIQVGLPAITFASMAEELRAYPFEERLASSLIVREPVGVVGAITPWNYPLHQIAAKVAPALAAGCTVVLKPSEVAPLNAFILAEIMDEAGVPAGVFNLVTGTGPVVGEVLAAHPDVDMVSFTGSTAAGKRVSELAARTVKRVALELGGKSPYVILDDADLTGEALVQAVASGVSGCYLNSGQTCSALTRMLVPRSRLPEVEAVVRGVVSQVRVGDPLAPGTSLGPLVSDVQRERVRGYIRKGIEEGAKLLIGGPDAPEGLERGYYVRPTVFSEVTPDMTIAREEIFGPVLVIQPYEDEEDAVRIANDTEYGLAGGVWSSDQDRALRVARRLRTGQVSVNGGAFNPVAPFGGYKQSGNGREFGRLGLEEFLEIKAIQL
ncbi:aldehyde dehydrogenase (NAD+) [Deinococcus reticulitermitis]|uniref:aldehyde dehydrogenase (NAD(+)) n=1 Tax=Deinococcus reticulitermitis TaxID=856736 RepID=A0A1H6ZHR3_9DEIO|nr:aldehyde dehydrogenase family protein [Deinococcus reticulitermitis]SEJ52838.1 aldehyde dehydrogenase (NAD+) [Deinococcus reticulitermitis]